MGRVIPFGDRTRERLVAAKPAFDREHCDGCMEMLSRGSLTMTLVDPKALGADGWKALCRRCIRLRSEAPE